MANVLAVSSNEPQLVRWVDALAREGHEVTSVTTVYAAEWKLFDRKFDVILFDAVLASQDAAVPLLPGAPEARMIVANAEPLAKKSRQALLRRGAVVLDTCDTSAVVHAVAEMAGRGNTAGWDFGL